MLKVENVNQSFGRLRVLKDISFTVNNDEILAVIGPSGCGKSTLLNIISGLQKPESGTVSSSPDRIAFIFQDDRLLPWLSVYDNIKVVNENHDREAILKLIEAVGLSGFENYRPHQISGGMKKRCGIARAFYYDSNLLLMDEAFQGLDYFLRQEMIKMLMRVWNQNKQSVLFITHEIDEALTVASKIAVLSDRPASVIKEYALPPYESRKDRGELMDRIRNEIISLITK